MNIESKINNLHPEVTISEDKKYPSLNVRIPAVFLIYSTWISLFYLIKPLRHKSWLIYEIVKINQNFMSRYNKAHFNAEITDIDIK